MSKTHTIECGSMDKIIIDKIFGPTVACELRISLDLDKCEWVIEREVVKKNNENYWEVAARIHAQSCIEFHD